MASWYVLVMLFIFIFEVKSLTTNISLGSSLSPTTEPTCWQSSSGRFAFGFYRQGGGFSVGTWLLTSPNTTIVWTANRDDPPVSSDATLTLTMDGNIILRSNQSKDRVIANTTGSSASFAYMLDSGNLVLYNNRSQVIWSSFDFPTDTLLEGQNLSTGHELFSSRSESDHSTGRYRLKMQDDGNLVLYPANTTDRYTEAYWASGTNTNEKYHLYLNYTGQLVMLNKTLARIRVLNTGLSLNDSIVYRATLTHEGFFRLFSHRFVDQDPVSKISPVIEWSVPQGNDLCQVKGFCGMNSYCTSDDNQPVCRCFPGTRYVDPNQTSNGCERNFVEQGCTVTDMGKSSQLYNITAMENMAWDDYPYLKAEMPEEDCEKSCLEDCDCDAALYKSEYCKKHKLPLKSARRDQGVLSTAYFKTGMNKIRSDDDDDNLPFPGAEKKTVRVTSKKAVVLILGLTVGFITCSCVFLAISGFFIFKYRVVKYKRLLEAENFGLSDELTLRSFSYKELKKATNGFKEELGKGSFGAVYKGSFHKGEKLVAVKRLEKVMNEGEREFQAEMHVIGRTHHKNLVRLFGYCAEDSKRLLVYEYMSNGSLADLLFRSERSPDWNERVRIALDVAKGILYLHDECEAPIIHCDIKPQNILMSELWTAKISDFGLAKLLMPDQTRTFTLIRGTRGYLAPEWYKNTPISVKADVYSYGVVLLEIVCCRRNMEVDPSKPEEIALINWVYKCFIEKELNKLVPGQEADKKTLENMIKVGLWCVQDEPALRPSIKSVVMMLEGLTDVSIPPCPTTSSSG